MVTAYTRILSAPDGRRLRPESQLPASKERLKNALVEEARRAKHEGSALYIQRLKTAYGFLGRFVTDEIASRDANPRTRQIDDLANAQEEERRLIQEFDSLMAGRPPAHSSSG